MKYNKNNKPLVCMLTNSTCYKETRTMNVLGVLWHSTGVNNPTLKRYVQPSNNDPNYNSLINSIGLNRNNNDFNHIERQAGLNAWIGKMNDGSVRAIQTMPWNYRPWGCGSGPKGSCNNGWIQFEICEDNLNDAAYFNKVYREACELTAYLCEIHGIDPKGSVIYKGVKLPTILCHADSHSYGFGSNHADVLHWFKRYGKTMNNVRNDVANIMTSNIPKKSINEIANEVIQGKWGSGDDRRKRLAAAGYNPTEVQKRVNEILAPKPEPIVPVKPTPIIPDEEDEDMTQEKFNEMMNNWIVIQANKEPSEWSATARNWAESKGLISGDERGRKMYKKFLTREEYVATLYKALKGKI